MKIQRDKEAHDRVMMTADQKAAAEVIRAGAKAKADRVLARAAGELKINQAAQAAKQKAAAAKKKSNGNARK